MKKVKLVLDICRKIAYDQIKIEKQTRELEERTKEIGQELVR